MSARDADWPRLLALFERLVDMPAAERERELRELETAAPLLHAHLCRLLALDASGEDIAGPVGAWRGIVAAEAGEADMPERIGAWHLLRPLGAGGMGRVFLAERADGAYEQQVALKIVRAELASPATLARFAAERRILARLDHPGIAALVDGGVDADGRPWFAMQYVDGRPLPAHCDEHGLGLDARLRLMIGVCDAAAYAHRQLVVHCDLKPSNVLVDAHGQPRLLDFGIARLLAADAMPADATQTQARAMTPGYAAPEQLAGAPPGIAADVYALGAMLHELLAGARPYAGDGDAPAAIALAQARGEPTPMSRTTSVNPHVPKRRLRGDLDLIVAKALRHDPAQRHLGADALADDLRRHLDGRPIAARRRSFAYVARRFVARHRVAAPLTTLAIAGLVATTAFALVQARDARRAAERAEVVRRFLVGVFDQASPEQNKGQPITAHQLLEKGERQVDRTAERAPGLKAEITALLAELYIGVGDFPRSLALIRQVEPALGDADVPTPVRARILLSRTWIDYEDGAYEDGLVHARESLALLQRSGGPEDIANAHAAIAYGLMGKGDWKATEEFARASLAADRAAIGDTHDAIASLWEQLGDSIRQTGRLQEAGVAFENAIAIYRTLYGDRSSHIAHVLSPYASTLETLDFPRAVELRREALAIHRALNGPDHHDTLVSEINLLGTLELGGRYGEILPQRLALIERAEKAGTLHSRDMATQYTSLGKTWRELGRFDEAEAALRHSLELTRAERGEDSPDTAAALRHLEQTRMLAGRYADADAGVARALQLRSSDPPASPVLNLLRSDLANLRRLQHRMADALQVARGADVAIAATPESAGHAFRIDVLAALSQAELEAGIPAAAASSGEAALELARRKLAPGHYQLGIPLYALARAELALERPVDAERLLREALAVRVGLHPADDPRVLEVKVDLVRALDAQRKAPEADALRAQIEPLLAASKSPYAADLRARLAR